MKNIMIICAMIMLQARSAEPEDMMCKALTRFVSTHAGLSEFASVVMRRLNLYSDDKVTAQVTNFSDSFFQKLWPLGKIVSEVSFFVKTRRKVSQKRGASQNYSYDPPYGLGLNFEPHFKEWEDLKATQRKNAINLQDLIAKELNTLNAQVFYHHQIQNLQMYCKYLDTLEGCVKSLSDNLADIQREKRERSAREGKCMCEMPTVLEGFVKTQEELRYFGLRVSESVDVVLMHTQKEERVLMRPDGSTWRALFQETLRDLSAEALKITELAQSVVHEAKKGDSQGCGSVAVPVKCDFDQYVTDFESLKTNQRKNINDFIQFLSEPFVDADLFCKQYENIRKYRKHLLYLGTPLQFIVTELRSLMEKPQPLCKDSDFAYEA